MKIHELERRTGLERPTIRFYEKERLIDPKRNDNGYREYSEEDAEHLLKIKLLRQLGMSIEVIRKLQQGSDDFGSAMSAQIRILISRIQRDQRAKETCEAIRADGVNYQTMDAVRYLKMLQNTTGNQPVISRNFQENIIKEIHPWRRYFARMLDYLLLNALICFILFVILRIRPIPGDLVSKLLDIGCMALFIPLEALMLSKWGTTPGKWVMGIRLEYVHGGNLPFSTGIHRSWKVFKGIGFGIPYISNFAMWLRYCQLTGHSWYRLRQRNAYKPSEMDWDEDTELIYQEWQGRGKAAAAGLLAVCVLLSSVTAWDSMKPKHRGSELTIAQFSENYNNTLRIMNEDHESYDELQPDGTKYPKSDQIVIFDVNGTSKNKDKNFTYQTVDGYLQTLSYEDSWREVFYLQPIPDDCYIAVMSILLAQRDWTFSDTLKFGNLWKSKLSETEAEFRYKNVTVYWKIEQTNCVYQNGILIAQSDLGKSTASVIFVLTIDET